MQTLAFVHRRRVSWKRQKLFGGARPAPHRAAEYAPGGGGGGEAMMEPRLIFGESVCSWASSYGG